MQVYKLSYRISINLTMFVEKLAKIVCFHREWNNLFKQKETIFITILTKAV